MGSEEDPADGAAVAASVFGAVAIYGVCHSTAPYPRILLVLIAIPGFPRLLRRPSLSAPTRQIKRRHCPVIIPQKHYTATNTFDNLTLVFRHHDHHHHFCFLGAALIFLRGSLCYRHFPLGGNRAQSPLCIPIIYLLQVCSFHLLRPVL